MLILTPEEGNYAFALYTVYTEDMVHSCKAGMIKKKRFGCPEIPLTAR